MSNERIYWFPAKRFGWGWGLPLSWQGWVVFKELAFFVGYVAVLSASLVAICWLKGEPPRWRWGTDDGA